MSRWRSLRAFDNQAEEPIQVRELSGVQDAQAAPDELEPDAQDVGQQLATGIGEVNLDDPTVAGEMLAFHQAVALEPLERTLHDTGFALDNKFIQTCFNRFGSP